MLGSRNVRKRQDKLGDGLRFRFELWFRLWLRFRLWFRGRLRFGFRGGGFGDDVVPRRALESVLEPPPPQAASARSIVINRTAPIEVRKCLRMGTPCGTITVPPFGIEPL